MSVGEYIISKVSAGVTWTQAEQLAAAAGGQLASLSSISENNLILAVLSASNTFWVARGNGELFGPWIGLQQAPNSAEPGGGWQWLDGSAFSPFGWSGGQPDNFQNDNVSSFYSFNGGTGWEDHVNDPTTIGFPALQSYVTEFAASTVSLTGTAEADYIIGGAGNNTIDGGTGADEMKGGKGNDTYVVDDSGDKVIEAANAGYDAVNTTLNTYKLGANVERVNFTGIGNFSGAGNDLDNRFAGGAGDDRFISSLGADVYGGGNGSDTVDYRTATTGVVLDFSTSTFGGAAAGNVFGSIEKFFGSDTVTDTMKGANNGRFSFFGYGGNDTLTGGGSVDQLSGGAGNDTLSGLAGKDSLDGGAGNDTITGGADADLFVYSAAGFGQDTITDFEDGSDRFKMNSAVADALTDFTITNNGSASVTLSLNADPTQTIAVHGAGNANVMLAASDFVFY